MALISAVSIEQDVYITDELKQVVDKVNSSLNTNVYYVFGEEEHIIKVLRELNVSQRYPLIAVVLPVDVQRGSEYYGRAVIPRVLIATLTDPAKSPAIRMETVIKPIVKPIYNEFLKQVKRHSSTFVIQSHIKHTERIRFGTQTAAQGFTEYIDGIEILNMEITLKNK
jgi:hypothetical protein